MSINIYTASEEELVTLDQIGEKRAKAIIKLGNAVPEVEIETLELITAVPSDTWHYWIEQDLVVFDNPKSKEDADRDIQYRQKIEELENEIQRRSMSYQRQLHGQECIIKAERQQKEQLAFKLSHQESLEKERQLALKFLQEESIEEERREMLDESTLKYRGSVHPWREHSEDDQGVSRQTHRNDTIVENRRPSHNTSDNFQPSSRSSYQTFTARGNNACSPINHTSHTGGNTFSSHSPAHRPPLLSSTPIQQPSPYNFQQMMFPPPPPPPHLSSVGHAFPNLSTLPPGFSFQGNTQVFHDSRQQRYTKRYSDETPIKQRTLQINGHQ